MQRPLCGFAHHGILISQQRQQGRDERRVSAVPRSDCSVAHHTIAPDALNGRARENFAEAGIVQSQQIVETRRDQLGAG